MHPLAHHLGEESLTQLVALGGTSMAVLLAMGRARWTALLHHLGFGRGRRDPEG
jgi:hypothetical protein